MALGLSKEVLVKIGGDSKGLQRAGQRSQAVIGRIGKSAKDMARNLGRIGAAAAGLGFATKRLFLDPFAEQQDALAALSQSLVSTGKIGEESLKLIADEAARLQTLTRFGDEALIKASSTLATLAPALNAPELAKAQTAIAAIADTFLKGDVEAAALLLGKTVGSTTNALTRYGISVDSSASASEKLAQILGSQSLGAAFDVAQAKARTFSGRIQQAVNVAGDLRETIGEIIVKSFGFTEGAETMAEKLSALNKRIEASSARWVAWTRVVIESVKFSAEVLKGLVRVAFNVGQLIGRAMDIAMSLLVGSVVEALEKVKKLANSTIETVNKIPGVNIGFRFQTRAEGEENPFFANADAQAQAFLGDLADIGDAVTSIADAWLGVQDATEGARNATGRVASSVPSAKASMGARIDFLLGQAGTATAAIPRASQGLTIGSGGVGVLTPEVRAMGEAASEAGQQLAVASDVVLDAFGNMAQAAVSGSQQMEAAIITSLQNVIANIQTKGGGLFGSTLFGGVVGLGLGLAGSLFGKSRGPVAVRVVDFDRDAERKLQDRNTGPDNITYIINAEGRPIEEIEYELRRRSSRDAVSRFPRGGITK